MAGLLTVTAVAAYIFRPPATPSGEITAVPVATTDSPPTESAATVSSDTPQVAVVTAEIVQSESRARFLINEVLNGQPKTVVGSTDQVAAQIIIDPADPANVQMGPVSVNARTLVTDNNFRNRAIQNEILDTGQYEFITFTPKEFIGLPETAAIGDTLSFQVLGDLTVRDVTREVTFDLSVTVDSDSRMHGLAQATISRNDFGLGVIDLPRQVASLEDPVILELEFVAAAVQQ